MGVARGMDLPSCILDPWRGILEAGLLSVPCVGAGGMITRPLCVDEDGVHQGWVRGAELGWRVLAWASLVGEKPPDPLPGLDLIMLRE